MARCVSWLCALLGLMACLRVRWCPFFWKEEDVNKKLEELMLGAFHSVYDTAQKENVDMRLAAQIVAVNRIAEALKYRGIYP